MEKLTADGITLRPLVKALAGRQCALQRALVRAINDSFQDAGVQPAVPRMQINQQSRARDDQQGPPPADTTTEQRGPS